MADTTTPPAPDGISIARLHGEACYHCGTVNGDLYAAGNVQTPIDGGFRIWPIVVCTSHLDAPPVTRLPAWIPAGEKIGTFAAGETWDAVRVSSSVGERVLQLLGERTGAVVADDRGRVFYWFVPAGSANSWTAPGSIALGVACLVTVPGAYGRGNVHWRVPILGHSLLTEPQLLANALAAIAAAGPSL